MNIEVGKYYRTRSGAKAYVAVVLPRSPFVSSECLSAFVGYVDGRCGRFSWDCDGSSMVLSDYDLVSEWQEPKKVRVRVMLFDSGSAMAFNHILDEGYPTSKCVVGWRDIEVEVKPGDKG